MSAKNKLYLLVTTGFFALHVEGAQAMLPGEDRQDNSSYNIRTNFRVQTSSIPTSGGIEEVRKEFLRQGEVAPEIKNYLALIAREKKIKKGEPEEGSSKWYRTQLVVGNKQEGENLIQYLNTTSLGSHGPYLVVPGNVAGQNNEMFPLAYSEWLKWKEGQR